MKGIDEKNELLEERTVQKRNKKTKKIKIKNPTFEHNRRMKYRLFGDKLACTAIFTVYSRRCGWRFELSSDRRMSRQHEK